MKTLAQSFILTATSALVLMLASTAAWSQTGAKGGAGDLVGTKEARPTRTVAAHGSTCPMLQSCADCRTVTKRATVTEGKGNMTKTLPVSEHLCPECKTVLQTNGHGKGKSTVSM